MNAERPRTGWFVSGWFDLLFIVGVPLFVWPLVMVGQHYGSADLLMKLILLTATGHYFATFARTYGDRLLLKRFKARLTVVPAVLLFTCVWAFTQGHAAAMLLVATGWGWWHWLAQAFGFARIYDAKIGSFRPRTAWLDKLLVIAWFLGAIVLNSNSTENFARLFLDTGVSLPDAAFFEVLRAVVLVVVVAITTAYVANVVWTLVQGERVSWIKQACHVMTIGFYWFAFGYMPSFFVSYVLYELFHDIQYFAIVWVSSRSRVQRGDVTDWMRRVFRPGWAGLATFLAVTIAFGAMDLGGRELSDAPMKSVLAGVFLTAALLHYYFDGFIWKLRESDLRHDFDLEGGVKVHGRRGISHAAAWGFFFVPLAGFAALASNPIPEGERARMLAGAAPESFTVQSDYALHLVRAGQLGPAIERYEKSLALYDGVPRIRLNYAKALDLAGRVADADAQYRAVTASEADAAIKADAWMRLGYNRLIASDVDGALASFKAMQAEQNRSPLPAMAALADTLERAGQTERAARLRQAEAMLRQIAPKR